MAFIESAASSRLAHDRTLARRKALWARTPALGPICVLDVLGDCLDDVDEEEAVLARRYCMANQIEVSRGPWTPPNEPDMVDGWLGLLIVTGLMTRTVDIEGLRAKELLGPGDVLRPWDHPGQMEALSATAAWQAVEPSCVALLDERFALVASRWPSIGARLLSSVVRRANGRLQLLALSRARRADDRLLLLFRYLADRWGKVVPAGVHIPLRLTHAVIGELACLRRPTVSMALGELRAAGALRRLERGTWLLSLEACMGKRATGEAAIPVSA